MHEEDCSVEIKNLNNQMKRMETEMSHLQQKLSNLKNKKNKKLEDLYIGTNFPWSSKVQTLLQETFKLTTFRSIQLVAINATLSRKDLLVLMATGSGKSLCYQLPALVGRGMTLVVSPLLSLIQDQQRALNKLGIIGMSINSRTNKNNKKKIYDYMSKGTKPVLKLLYVTPEWLNKSKMFKSYLQKCHGMGNLDRIAIDEVHCCSQWGHDFRPDYQFLSLLKDMCHGVPIIGLTATATLSVLLDIQNMLNIPDCLIFKSSFNRPNLFYKVVSKPPQNEDCLAYLENLLTRKYRNKSGIIYASSVKDTEELAQALRSRGIRIQPYHSNLELELRNKVQGKWINNEYQAVVATAAFGMGIDKPDVRFVIHHSIPKSMESLYQESGRAGRDGKKAHCILMYRFSDFCRGNAFIRSKTEETKLRSVLQYCLNSFECRRKLIATHFDEKSESDNCNQMCDNCKLKLKSDIIWYDITPACKYIYSIIEKAERQEVNLTLLKLLDAWFKTGDKSLRVEHVEMPNVARQHAELIIAFLMMKGYLLDYKSYTTYAANCYIQKGKGCRLTASTVIEMPLSASINIKNFKKRTSSEDEPSSKRIKIY